MRSSVALVALVVLPAAIACGGGGDGPVAPTLVLNLRAPDPQLVPGQTTTLELSATTNGQPGSTAGATFITAESTGCAIFENYITPTNLSPGRSISIYNPATDRWYQTYIDAGNNMVLLRSTSFADGMIPMVSPPQGNVFTRTTWSRNGDGSVRQFIEATLNNGQSFLVQYDMLYRRK